MQFLYFMFPQNLDVYSLVAAVSLNGLGAIGVVVVLFFGLFIVSAVVVSILIKGARDAEAQAEENLKTEIEERKKAEARAENEAKARTEAEKKLQAEKKARTTAEAEAQAKNNARMIAEEKAAAYARARDEAERKAESEVAARTEAEERAKAEVEARIRAEEKLKDEIKERARIEKEAAEAIRLAKAEAEEKAKSYAQLLAEAEQKLKTEIEERKKAETKAGDEARAKAKTDKLAKTGIMPSDEELATGSKEVADSEAKCPTSEQLDVDFFTPPQNSTEPHSERTAKRDNDTSVQMLTTTSERQPVYQPSVRTAGSVRPRVSSSQGDTGSSQQRPLSMSVRIVFGHRNNWHVSLLPGRSTELSDSLQVQGPNGTEEWNAYQDEWYEDIHPPNLQIILENGARWESCQANSSDIRWVLSGREIYVLAPATTISGYVSVPRLILSEDHLVLCKQPMEEVVRQALSEAGCSAKNVVSNFNESLPGWLLFQGVRPTVAIEHDDSVGLLNILRPVHDVEIVLRGGIRLGRSKWLNDYPPDVRIRGMSNNNLKVIIDGKSASANESGNYTAPNWDNAGIHIVFCAGVSQSYELCDGLHEWECFKAFEYEVGSQNSIDYPSVMICGPIVKSTGEENDVTLTPTTNNCLLGAVPGNVAITTAARNIWTSHHLTVAEFPIAWTLPACPLRCDRRRASIKLVRPLAVASEDSTAKISQQAKLRWCYKILNASRRRLRVEPNTDIAKQLWKGYKQAARQLWRKLR